MAELLVIAVVVLIQAMLIDAARRLVAPGTPLRFLRAAGIWLVAMLCLRVAAGSVGRWTLPLLVVALWAFSLYWQRRRAVRPATASVPRES